MTPRRPRASVTSQTKPLEESMPVAAAATYVLRSCREPNCPEIRPPRVCVCSAFTHLSVNAASWFDDVFLGGFYFPRTRAVVMMFNIKWRKLRSRGLTRWCRKKLLLRARLA
jgi:hypothetical protein